MKYKTFAAFILIFVFILSALGCARGGNNPQTTAGEEPALSIVDPASDTTAAKANDPTSELVSETPTESTTEAPTQTEPSETEPTEPSETEFQPDPDEDQQSEPATVNELTEAAESTAEAVSARASATGEAIAKLAADLIGAPFEMGAAGPDAFDNSGFVYYCCKENGVSIPRRTGEFASAGTEVSKDELRPGDIVLFSTEIGGDANFAGIYIGNGQFVSCNNTDSPAGVRDITGSHWADRFICGRRVG